MRYFVTIGGQTFEVDMGPDGVFVDGEPVEADLTSMPRNGRTAAPRASGAAGSTGSTGSPGSPGVLSLLVDAEAHRIVADRTAGGCWELHLRGGRLRADVVDERTRTIRETTAASSGPEGPQPVRAPMPGLVVLVEVAEGDVVSEGQGIAIVEAMKMENELKAEAGARVDRVHVQAGQIVEKGQILVDFVPLPEGS